jgi:hypothetical protein
MEITLPPTLARNMILTVMHYIPPYSGVDRIIIYEDKVKLEGKDVINGLREALKIIANNVKKTKFIIPSSGNDKEIIKKLFKCYNINENDSPDEQILTFSNFLLNECNEKLRLPSLLKPELYEYDRTPGYIGKRKMEIKYPPMSIMLGLIGYLGSKVGIIASESHKKSVEKFKKNREYTPRKRQSVLLTPQEVWSIDPQFSSELGYFLNYMNSRKYFFPNIHPETALFLWLALHIGLSNFRLFIINDPIGRKPATLDSQLTIDLSRIKEALDKYGILQDFELCKRLDNILLNALSDEHENITIRFSSLLYEMFLEIKPWDEVLFFGLRDYMSNLLLGGKEKKQQLLEDIGIASETIFKKLQT